MLPPWLAESDGGGAGYEEPVQNLPHEDLIDDSPRRKDKKKRKGLFGRDKDSAAEQAPERGSDSWSQPQPGPDPRTQSRPRQSAPDAGPTSWSQPQPEVSRDPWGQQQPGHPVPPHTAPGLPTRQPGEHRGSFQPLGQPPAGDAPDPMPSNEATTRYTRPEPDAPVAERPPLPPARLPEPPAHLPDPPAPGDRPYLSGPSTGAQPSTPEPRPREFDGPPAGARPELPGPPPGFGNPEFDSAPPVSGGRPPLPEPPSTVGDQGSAEPHSRREFDGPPPWLAGPSDPGHLGLDPEESQADPAQSGSGPIPRGRHWLPPDHKDNAQPNDPASASQAGGEQPGSPGAFAPGDQRGPDGRRIPAAFAPPAAGTRAPVSDQLAPGERRDPGVFNQPPSQPFTGQSGDPNTFAPAASGQPGPGERRDPGMYDQPPSQPVSGQPGDPNAFAGSGQRAPVGDQPAPGERRDPGVFNQPPSQPFTGQPSAANNFAPPAMGQRAPVSDQLAPGERRDPGVFNQPPSQPISGQPGDPNTFAPAASGQPGPPERRDPGMYDQPPSQPISGQPSGTNNFAPGSGPAGSNPPFNGQANAYAPPASAQRAPVGDQPAPGERRDPGVFNQPPSQPFTGQSAPGAYAAPASGQRAPVGDQPAPGERRDPGVFNQPPSQPFTGQPSDASNFAPTGQPGPGGQAPGGYAPNGPGQGTGPQPSGWDQPQAPNQQQPNQQHWQQGPGQQQGGQWSNGPRPNHGGPQPSLDDVPLRRAKKAPGGGWRKAVHHMSGGAINPGMSAEELRLQELVARIRQPVRGDYRIAVLSLKGGVGKTTTTMGLGSIFASIRGDRVIAVDANPDFGTLSQRVPLQTRSTVRDLLLDPNVERYSDVRKHTSQATSRLEVLASERDPAASEQFDEHEYRAVARILQRYYNIILTDCGTGLTHSAMSGVLDLAHSLVLISSAAIDGARSAAATLDWLSLHGHDHLVRNAVVVINLPREGSVNVGIQQLREYFLSRCRAVHIIPFDDHLSEGAEIDLHRLSKQAKRAYVELAATVADEFNIEHRRYN